MFNQLKKLLGFQEQKQALPIARQMARQMAQPQRLQPKQYMTLGGGRSQFLDQPQTVANLTPATEDGYDTTIKYLNGSMQSSRMPMDMDTIPTNFTAGRTGYFQGSNPYVNGRNWVDPQMQDFAPGGGVQSSSFGAWQPRKRY